MCESLKKRPCVVCWSEFFIVYVIKVMQCLLVYEIIYNKGNYYISKMQCYVPYFHSNIALVGISKDFYKRQLLVELLFVSVLRAIVVV